MHTRPSRSASPSARRALGATLLSLVALSLVAFLAGCGGGGSSSSESTPPAATNETPPATTTETTPPATDAMAAATPEDRGKALFPKCVQCHKADGTGGVKLTGNPTPNWTDKARMATIKDADLHDCIYNGKLPSGMVAWGKTGQLTEDQITDLIAYIRTFSK